MVQMMRARRLLVPGVVFVLAAIVAIVTLTRNDGVATIDTSGVASSATDNSATTTAPVSQESTPDPDSDRPSRGIMEPIRVTEPAMAIGDEDAPLVMVTFESFGCLWCGNFHRLTMPGIYEKYVDTGLLRIEARMMPYEERAVPGALVGTAAGMQGRYWELAEVLYPFISGNGEPPIDRELNEAELGDYRQRQTKAGLLAQVEAHADEIGLDYEQFLIDYDSAEAERRMSEDADIGYAIGFTGTPSIVVNGVPLGGYVGYDAFDEFLTSVLEASTG